MFALFLLFSLWMGIALILVGVSCIMIFFFGTVAGMLCFFGFAGAISWCVFK